MADLKVVLHVEWGLKVSLDEVFSVIKLSTFFGLLLGVFGFDLVVFNLLILWRYLKPLESLLFLLPQQNKCINICLMHPVPALVYSDNKFFHFSQVIYSLCSVSMTTVRKWERITAWWWWHWQGTHVTSDFLVNLYSTCCPSWQRMSDCSVAIPLIHHLGINCSE